MSALRRRKFTGYSYNLNGGRQALDFPCDSVFIKLNIRASGGLTYTFGSGTPVADAYSTMGNLISTIDFYGDNGEQLKQLYPSLTRFQDWLVCGFENERASSAGASILASNYPTTQNSGFTYGTTTQSTTVREFVTVYFAYPYAQPNIDWYYSTCLDLRQKSGAQLALNYNPAATAGLGLLGYGNTAPVVFTASTINFEITTEETYDFALNYPFLKFRQMTAGKTLSASMSDEPYRLSLGNKILGITMLCRNGAAGTTTTATGNVGSDIVISNLKIVVNNNQAAVETVIDSTWLSLKDVMVQNYGIDISQSSNIGRADGFNRIDFCQFGRPSDALNVAQPLVSDARMLISTNSGSIADYTTANLANVLIQQDELITPPGTLEALQKLLRAA